MIYADVCSGISAATLAWKPLGWRCAFYSEVDRFPCAVLAHHYPDTPNFGDMRDHANWPLFQQDGAAIDVLVGGTPCQGFSIAGLRQGLDDSRSNLALQFLLVARRYKPRWLVFENVPGIRSQNGGRDFGAVLGGMAELGYGVCYRSLDAQYAGLAQRRERIFVVGYLGDWRPPFAVLFEREGLRWDSPPRREKGQGTAAPIASCTDGGSGYRLDADTTDSLIPAIANPLTHRMHKGVNTTMDEGQTMIAQPLLAKENSSHRTDMETYVAHALRADGFDASEDGTGRGTPMVPVAFAQNSRSEVRMLAGDGGLAGAVAAEPGAQQQTYIAFDAIAGGKTGFSIDELPGTLRGPENGASHLAIAHELTYGVEDGTAPQARSVEALRALRDAVGEEAFLQWSLGILTQLLPTQILRPEMYGLGFRWPAQSQHGLVNVALSRSQAGATWTVLDLWKAGCDGCPPSGWQPSEQLARELGASLSKLPYQASPQEGFMQRLRQAGTGSRLLRDALSALEEARRPSGLQDTASETLHSVRGNGECTEPVRETLHAGQTPWAVRRLSVEECEALQGAPRGYTAIPWRGKPASACPDGPRYKSLGNSIAIPELAWIARRIMLCEEVMHDLSGR